MIENQLSFSTPVALFPHQWREVGTRMADLAGVFIGPNEAAHWTAVCLARRIQLALAKNLAAGRLTIKVRNDELLLLWDNRGGLACQVDLLTDKHADRFFAAVDAAGQPDPAPVHGQLTGHTVTDWESFDPEAYTRLLPPPPAQDHE